MLWFWLPEMLLHVDVTVGPERHSLFFEQCALTAPARSRAAFGIHHSVTGQRDGFGRVAQGAPHHSRVAGPSCPSRDNAVGGHLSAGNLAYDIQNVVAELPRLLWGHSVGEIVHFFSVELRV